MEPGQRTRMRYRYQNLCLYTYEDVQVSSPTDSTNCVPFQQPRIVLNCARHPRSRPGLQGFCGWATKGLCRYWLSRTRRCSKLPASYHCVVCSMSNASKKGHGPAGFRISPYPRRVPAPWTALDTLCRQECRDLLGRLFFLRGWRFTSPSNLWLSKVSRLERPPKRMEISTHCFLQSR